MKVALDVDGVLADVMASWLVYNNKVRDILSKQDLTDWDFWKNLQIGRSGFYDELAMCWKNWISILPTEQNLPQLTKNLSTLAHVDIVTARENSTDPYVKDWLKMHEITYENYVSVTDGSIKAELCYDVFIDDSPLNARDFLRHNKTVLLYSQPWNLTLSDSRLRRISSLSEAIGILKS